MDGRDEGRITAVGVSAYFDPPPLVRRWR